MRRAVSAPTQSRARNQILMPPVRGMVSSEALAASKPGGALVLENWVPTRIGARVRGGIQKYATVSTGPVRRMFTYRSGSQQKFFSADDTTIVDITTVADADTIPTAAVSGQTSGYYSVAQIGTAGGDYLSAVNGTDTPKLFDGSTWTSHSFTGLATPANLNFVWSFAQRLWYIKKNSMIAYYLPVDSINGALTAFSLAGVFKQGGFLVFGGSWSLDAGDGLDDKCIFVSSTGEVAVYQGTDPSSAADWQKVGVYQISPMVGPNATMQAGGDLLVGTEVGVVPISEAVNRDVSALSLAAVSADIEPDWKSSVASNSALPWEIMKWPSNNMMVVSVPTTSETAIPYCFIKNLETGAWSKFTGWDTQCMAQFGTGGFFGTKGGVIYQMEIGGTDDGMPYVCTYVGLPDHLKAPSRQKMFHSMRYTFRSSGPFDPQISASIDYETSLPPAPSSVADYQVSVWDNALWDQAQWDAASGLTVSSVWASIGQTGFVVMPQVQITFGITPTPRVEMIAGDILSETGEVMV